MMMISAVIEVYLRARMHEKVYRCGRGRGRQLHCRIPDRTECWSLAWGAGGVRDAGPPAPHRQSWHNSNVEPQQMDATQTVRAYKNLSKVERAFRSLKSVDLKVRPLHHRRADGVRAHVLLCMLAYYVEWHMRQKLVPLLFDGPDPQAGERTADDLPVHSFRTLLTDLATLTVNTMQVADTGARFPLQPQPTPVQQRCFQLLGVTPRT